MQKLLYSLVFLVFTVSCKKSVDATIDISTFSDVEVIKLQENSSTNYVLKSKLNLNPGENVSQYGFVYSYQNPVFNEIFNDSLRTLYTFNGSSEVSATFEDTLFQLGLPVAYRIKPYALNAGRISFGKEIEISPTPKSFNKITCPDFTNGALNGFSLASGKELLVGGGNGNRMFGIYHSDSLKFIYSDTLPDDFANEYCTSFTLGNKGYVVGGVLNNNVSNQVYMFDFANRTWTKKQNFPGASRGAASSVVVNNQAYVGFGIGNSNAYKDLWKYDESNDLWTAMASPGSEISGRAFLACFAIGNNIYFVGGSSTTSLTNVASSNNFWQYNSASNSWKALPNCPFESLRCFSFSSNNDGYIGFGVINASNNLILGYNESNGKWFGHYDGTQGTMVGSNKAYAIKFNDKYYAATMESNELIEVK